MSVMAGIMLAETFWGGYSGFFVDPEDILRDRLQPPLDDHRGRRRQASLTVAQNSVVVSPYCRLGE